MFPSCQSILLSDYFPKNITPSLLVFQFNGMADQGNEIENRGIIKMSIYSLISFNNIDLLSMPPWLLGLSLFFEDKKRTSFRTIESNKLMYNGPNMMIKNLSKPIYQQLILSLSQTIDSELGKVS